MSSGGGDGGLKLPFFHELHETLESTPGKSGFFLPVWWLLTIMAGALIIFGSYAPNQSGSNWGILFLIAPVWMPIIFGRFALARFLTMRQAEYNYKNPFVLLEMKIPREILKSPKAMEVVFASLHINPGEGTWLKKYWWGRTRPWWAFEIASFSGEIHFYVWTRTSMRRLTETALYAQYPEIELIEAVDYTRLRDPSHAPYRMFACEYEKGSSHSMPIATYVDYGLDKDPKQEFQIDPFSQVLELFGTLGPEEQLWTQIIFRVTRGEHYRGKKKPGSTKAFTWVDEGNALIAELREKIKKSGEYVDEATGVTKPGSASLMNATEGQKLQISALERNISMKGFDVGMRSIYSAPADKYQVMNPFVANMWKPFHGWSPLGPAPLWSEKYNDYPWEDPGGKQQAHDMHEVTELFRWRAFFHPPYRGKWFHMSSEELATIFHVPSSAITTPTLPRIGSTAIAPPANVPH